MHLEFIKMQGVGNDYVYIDCMQQDITLDSAAIVRLSDRHFGVGGDGVIFVRKSEIADGAMDMYNMDGSRGKMCGNGVRCVGKFLYDAGYAKKETIAVETLSGVKSLTMQVEGGVATGASVDMGTAILSCPDIPVLHSGSNIDIPVLIGDVTHYVTCVSMGNPHAVLFLDEVASLDLPRIGPQFEAHPLFPERVNTEFIRVISDSELEMRVWERGSGETLACGTGACAAVVAAVLNGYCDYDTPITVHLLGGDLTVLYLHDGTVTMAGDATEVFRGTIEL